MSKTSKELLQEVHSMLAEYFLEELKMTLEEGIPLVSSTLPQIIFNYGIYYESKINS